jgi:serine/threonine protein kinase
MPEYHGDPLLVEKCIIKFKELNTAGINSMNGSFGSVRKMEIDGTPYFVKEVYANELQYDRMKIMMVNEYRVNKILTSRIPEYVSRFIAGKLDNTGRTMEMYLIFEAPNGYNLKEYLNLLTASQLERIYNRLYCSIKAAQVAINSLNIVHRDIKPENIYVLVGPDGKEFKKCKLIDLGLAMKAGEKVNPAGTGRYMPPTMRLLNNYRRIHNFKAFKEHNEYSLEQIWKNDFQKDDEPVPNCEALRQEVGLPLPEMNNNNNNSKGGSRKTKRFKKPKRKTRRLK